ncbi:Nucleotide-binding, alpha-beta plait [Metarhizium rileyi]|uniref:Nucleotide-binding, alpha-beta plait n=1 Tax=Metarhizium rileyi (strain RCEF 4871) TaxID=1649241 RepID=A0A167E0P0_METRR|nr:Nucleotide-binding, alpha-beta plait [Metarhizium rileyi RCEF 4871]
MSRQGGSEKKVIMADVEPGEKTGVYYMPICNDNQLPFGTSWQDFKDWLRADCDVDHVELFQSSTSGWIRLRGEDNFNKAWSRMKKEYFRNRAIIASDRNRTECIKIKELVDSRVAQYSTPGRWDVAAGQSRNPEPVLSASGSCTQEAVTLNSPLGIDYEFGRLSPPISCPAGPVTTMSYAGGMPVLDSYTAVAESYNTMNTMAAMRNHALVYPPAYGYVEALPETGLMPDGRYSGSSQYGESQPADSQYASSHQSNASIHFRMAPGASNHPPAMGGLNPSDTHQRVGYAAEEPCKVIVTSIQHKARQSEVANWIRHQIGEYSSAIAEIDIPLVEPQGRIRGHALITLVNLTAAEATVRILDQKLFQGRVVSTRLTTEGILDAERHNPSKDARARPHRSDPAKEPSGTPRQIDPSKSHRDEPRRHKPQSRTFNSSPTPSSTRRSSASKTTEDTIRSAGPVIAHGSSNRKPDKK